MDWIELFEEAGLSDREAKSLVILSSSKELKASDLAKKLGTNRLDAYNSLSRLTQIGLVIDNDVNNSSNNALLQM